MVIVIVMILATNYLYRSVYEVTVPNNSEKLLAIKIVRELILHRYGLS